MPETFKGARMRLMAELETLGWVVARGLKLPHATEPRTGLRLWFKPQAVWASEGTRAGDARSLHVDPRGASASLLVRLAGSY